MKTQNSCQPVQITPFYSKKGEPRQIVEVQNVREYIDDAKKSKTILCEYISYDKDVNPYFDADLKIVYDEEITKKEFEFRENKLHKECMDMISKIFEKYDGDLNIYQGKKNYRILYNKGKKTHYKISIRYWIKGIKIKTNYLWMLLDQCQPIDDSPFDKKVYNNGRVIILPEFHKPKTEDDPSQTVLLPCENNYDISNYTITNVKDNDYDLNNDVKKLISNFVDNSEKSDSPHQEIFQSYDIITNPEEIICMCKKYVNGFKIETADDFKKWCDIGFALKNTGVKYLFENKAFEMFKHFSKKSNKYEDDKILKQWQGFKVGGSKAAGLPTLKKYYMQDIMKDENEELLRTQGYDIVKNEFEKNICKVLADCTFIRKDNEDIYYIKRETLLNTYENLFCYTHNHKNEVVKTPFVSQWLKDENNKKVKKIVFDPSKKCEDEVYNLFTGFRAETLEPVPDDEVDKLIEPILFHFREVLFGEHWEYYVDLDRNIIQNPDTKSGVIVVIKGQQGTGKSITIDELLRKRVIGKKFASQCAGITPLFDRFATETSHKLLALCDEINIKECVGSVGEKMKNLATASTIQVETKGVNKITLDNHINLRLTSNHENPITIPHDDRRYVVFEAKDTYLHDTEYRDRLVEACTSDRVARAYYQYLLRPMKVTHFQGERPKTDYYKEVVKRNLPPIDRFLSFIVLNDIRWKYQSVNTDNDGEEDNVPNTQDYKASTLYQVFCNWCKERRWENVITSTAFGSKLGVIIKEESGGIVKLPRRNDGVYYKIDKKRLHEYLQRNNRFDDEIF